MLAPVASALGIDLIWFGVLICINMQTSFMHPPFVCSLLLRSIAPRSVKTSDIYMGAIPWLCMQLILVAIVIFWPETVTYWLDHSPPPDLNNIKIDVPSIGGLDGGAMPNFGTPPLGGDQPGAPPINLGEPPKINP